MTSRPGIAVGKNVLVTRTVVSAFERDETSFLVVDCVRGLQRHGR